MKKLVYVLGLTLGISFSSFASFNSTTIMNDSLKNEITFSEDQLGYNSYSLKFNHKIASNLWLKVGLISYGDYEKIEPKHIGYSTSSRTNSIGLILGLDNHSNNIIKGLECTYGFNFRLFYLHNKIVDNDPTIPIDEKNSENYGYYSGIGLSFGLYYNFSNKFAIGSEINPYFDYLFYNSDNYPGYKEKGYRYDIFGNISIISIKFRW